MSAHEKDASPSLPPQDPSEGADDPGTSLLPGEPKHGPTKRRQLLSTEVRVWLVPFSLLTLGAVLVFLGPYLLDSGRSPSPGLWHILTHLEGESAIDILVNVAQVTTQVLGVAISVVAIIVELAANRYTHRITELFFREPVNFGVLGLFVIGGLDAMWVSMLFREGFVPHYSALVAVVLMSLSALLLLPYFAYVFEFLNPMNVVRRIRAETLAVVKSAPRDIALAHDNAERIQRVASDGSEQLTDVALNAMSNHDGTIAVAAVNALGDLSRDYMDVKGALPLDWFPINENVAQNPDFVSMAPEVLEDLGRSRAWYEFKLLRQLQTCYQGGLGGNRELCYVVAIRTRELGERAMDHHDPRVAELCIKFFNTYLRATVNARDVRTAYNVFNQYRLLADGALRRGAGRFAVEIARYFKYYGQLAFQMDLGFVLETAAYDLCSMNELAFDLKSPERAELLRTFLQVDKEGEGGNRERSLRGVRKAQVKLATYYLERGDEPAAREVFKDMHKEQPERLASIRDELLAITSSQFWEITDRGTNFDYITPDRKRRLMEFFEWFGGTIPPVGRLSLVPGESPVTVTATPSQEAMMASVSAARADSPSSDPMPRGGG